MLKSMSLAGLDCVPVNARLFVLTRIECYSDRVEVFFERDEIMVLSLEPLRLHLQIDLNKHTCPFDGNVFQEELYLSLDLPA